jgi:hypothetical protein
MRPPGCQTFHGTCARGLTARRGSAAGAACEAPGQRVERGSSGLEECPGAFLFTWVKPDGPPSPRRPLYVTRGPAAGPRQPPGPLYRPEATCAASVHSRRRGARLPHPRPRARPSNPPCDPCPTPVAQWSRPFSPLVRGPVACPICTLGVPRQYRRSRSELKRDTLVPCVAVRNGGPAPSRQVGPDDPGHGGPSEPHRHHDVARVGRAGAWMRQLPLSP